jgi:hypothetical protein
VSESCRQGIGRSLRPAVLVIVAAGSVGFAVGDALATPHPTAATFTSTDSRFHDSGKVDFERGWHLAPGRTIEIKGINGSIVADAASGDRVEVTARKRWRRSDPDPVRIDVVEHDGDVTLCVVYPGPHGEPNICEPGDGGRMNVSDNDVKVDFDVRVPRGVRLAAHTVNGDLDLGRLDGDVEARTVNGSIRLATRGVASAATVNGSIDATIGRTRGPLRFETVNGAITLEIPGGVDADVRAETLNGTIASEFPLEIHGRMPRRASGTIGAGGPALDLRTVNGSIDLMRSR